MEDRGQYHRTIAVYCKDFISSVKAIESFGENNYIFEEIVNNVLNTNEDSVQEIIKFKDLMSNYELELSSMCDIQKDNDFLLAMWQRAKSISKICTDEISRY